MNEGAVDSAGYTVKESEAETASERYERAGQRYEELNQFVAEESRRIAEVEWMRNGVSPDVFPIDGAGREEDLRGANEENSYYFEVIRVLADPEALQPIQRATRERWELRNWWVGVEKSELDGSLRIEAITDQGYWVALDEYVDGLYLTAHTPPYWGEYLPLADDIHERYEAEKARGEHARYDIEEDEHLSLLPGDYRPFPRWDAVE